MAAVAFEVRNVSPSEAREMLARKRSAAPIRMAHVRAYAKEMSDGRWVLNGDPIIIGRSGALLSGVLRLEAAKLADASFPALIIRDIDDATFETIDSVRRRTLSDILAIRKEASGRILASALTVLWKYSSGNYVKGARSPTPQSLLDVLTAHPEMRTSVELTRGLGSTFPHGVAAALHYLCSRVDPSGSTDFFNQLKLESPSAPAVQALRRQMSLLSEQGGARHQPFLIGIAVKAWEAFRKGQDIKVLRFNPDGDDPPYISGLDTAGFEVCLRTEALPINRELSASQTLTVEAVQLDPTMAMELLAANTNNRTVAAYVVDKYSRDMKAGVWRVNGQTIKIGKSGRLLDGQHRLHAGLQSGVTFPAIIVRGLDEGVFETFDLGARRSLADVLIDRDESNTSTLAAALRQVWLIENDLLTSQNASPTIAEMLETLDRHPAIRESVRFASRVKHVTAPTLVVALHYFFTQKDSMLADTFVDRLIDGSGLGPKSPILKLRDQLMRARNEKKFKQSDPERAAWIIKAWNAFAEGRSLDHIKWQPYGTRAEAFPVIRSPHTHAKAA